MRTLWRPTRRGSHRRPDCWPTIGLAAGLVLLAGCGLSGASGGGSGTGSPTPGQVTLATNQQRYAPSEPVVVTVTNGLAVRILAADHQSDCTVVTIERQNDQTWQPQNPCRLMSPTRLIPLDSGSAMTLQLQPPQGTGTAGWTPGTYRIALSYRHSASDEGTTIYSATFVVA
ncbi:MAG: hypothetical protein PVSMB4_19260 [Ktedonobacterales bacterium]